MTKNGALGDRECIACPANFYCYQDATTACPANSQSLANSSVVADCKCNAGYYWNAVASTCPVCPPGSYCKNNLKQTCPAHTNSPQGSSLQTDCACLAGYTCKIVRDATVAIRFQLTQAEFDSRAATIRTKLAELARVPEASVTFETRVAGRRLLQVPWGNDPAADPLLDITAHILSMHTGTDLAVPIGI